MTDSAFKPKCLALMEKAEVVFLSTIDSGGCPHTRAVFNLRRGAQFPNLAPLFLGHEDDLMVLVSTNTSSNKVRHVRENPAVALYFCEPGVFHGLLLQGRAELVDDLALKRALWQPGWERYYPAGVEDPDFAVLRIFPTKASGWWECRRFEFGFEGA